MTWWSWIPTGPTWIRTGIQSDHLIPLKRGGEGGTRGHSGRVSGVRACSLHYCIACLRCAVLCDGVTDDGRWDGRWSHGLTGDGMCVVGIFFVGAGFWVTDTVIPMVWYFIQVCEFSYLDRYTIPSVFVGRYVTLRIRNRKTWPNLEVGETYISDRSLFSVPTCDGSGVNSVTGGDGR
jgi:hypothetical protein